MARMSLVLVLAFLGPGVAQAARIETGAACSLVDAITSANTNAAVGGCIAGDPGRDTVVVAAATLSAADNGSNALPVVVEDLTITSADPDGLGSIRRDATVGTPDFRLLEIGTAAIAPAVTLRRLAIANGRVVGALDPGGGVPFPGAGGCVLLRNGALTVVDSDFEDCAAVGIDNGNGPGSDGDGGAIAASSGSLTVRGSSFGFNHATGGAALAAGFTGGSGQGGAIYASGPLTGLVIRDTSIIGNSAGGGAGVTRGGNGRGGGLAVFSTGATLTGTSLSANAAAGGAASAGTSGSGIGGGAAIVQATLSVSDGEFADNVASGPDSTAELGGQADGGGLDAAASTLTLTETAVTGNRATAGDGPVPASNGLGSGGGMRLSDTTVTADGVTVESNSASGNNPTGGGIAVEHGGAASTPFLMTRSTLAANQAVATQGSARGGGLYQDGDVVTIRNSDVSGNSADIGGGLFQASGSLVATLSTLAGNAAGTRGGGVAVEGGLDAPNAVELANATVSGNGAGTEGGGLYLEGTQLAPGLATIALANVTVTGNTNGGIQLVRDRNDPLLDVGNSIVGAQASGADCAITGTAAVTTGGGNLESGTTCGFTDPSDRQSVADPGLAPLGGYGGRTLTHDLLPGSPAIDAGRRGTCNREANGKDERGLARFYDGNGDRDFACDSGAVEFQGLLHNPGFEDPLNQATDWILVASGGSDGRVRTAAPSGRFALTLTANAAAESLTQTVPLAGGAGERYALTFLAQGAGLPTGDAFTVTLRTAAAGADVDAATCTLNFPSPAFTASSPVCALTTTAPYTSLTASLAWDGVAVGTLTLDAVSLVRQ